MNQAEAIRQLHLWGQRRQQMMEEREAMEQALRERLSVSAIDAGFERSHFWGPPLVRIMCTGRHAWSGVCRGGDPLVLGATIEDVTEKLLPIVSKLFEDAEAPLSALRRLVKP